MTPRRGAPGSLLFRNLLGLTLLVVGTAGCGTTLPSQAWIEGASPAQRRQIVAELRAAQQDSPQRPEVLARLALTLLLQGKAEEAEPLALAAGSRTPFDGEINALLGEIHLSLGKRFRALTAFARAVDFQPDLLSGYVGLARTQHLLGRSTEALAVLARAAEREPSYFPTRYQQAVINLETGNTPAALAALAQAENIRPRDPTLLLLRVRIKKTEGNFGTAALLTQEGLAARPDSRELLVEWLDIQYRRGEWGPALQALQKLQAQGGGEPGWTLVRAEILAAQGQAAEAQALVSQVVARFPAHVPARVVLGRSLLAQGRPAEAMAPLQLAAEGQPNGVEEFFWKAAAHYQLGQTAQGDATLDTALGLGGHHPGVRLLQARRLIARGDSAGAHGVVNALLKDFPGHPGATITRGELLTLDGNFEAAETTLAALPPDPPSPAFGFALARLAHAQGHHAAVLAQTAPLAKDTPVPWQVAFLHAWALNGLQRTAEAVSFLKPMVGKKPASPTLVWLEGELLHDQDNAKDAMAVLENGLGAFPGDPLLLDAATRLAVEQGQFKEALRLLEVAVGKAGPLHPVFLERLGRVSRALKNSAGAREQMTRYRAVFDPILGSKPPGRAVLPSESPYLAGLTGVLPLSFLTQGSQ